jgi:hypothetical protein
LESDLLYEGKEETPMEGKDKEESAMANHIKGLLACMPEAYDQPGPFRADLPSVYSRFGIDRALQDVINRAGAVGDPALVQEADKRVMLDRIWEEIGTLYGLPDPELFKANLRGVLARFLTIDVNLRAAIDRVAQNGSTTGVQLSDRTLILDRIWDGYKTHYMQVW